jgi:hypothetical protein
MAGWVSEVDVVEFFLLHFAVGLGRETPCKLTAAPEASRCRPDSFREVRYERHSRYDVYSRPL